MVTIIVFLLVLSALVLIHEFGHFIVAKRAGIGVLEFALGLPFTKPIWSKKLKSGMRLSFYPVLFGGFVKLKGEDAQPSGAGVNEDEVAGKRFFEAPVWTRISVVVAGVIMNLLLAITIFYIFLGVSGFRSLIPKLAPYNFISPSKVAVVVVGVEKGSPAADKGLIIGDVVESVDGKSFAERSAFQSYVKSKSGVPIKLALTDLLLTEEKIVNLTPRVNPPKGQGAMGIGIGEGYILYYDTVPQKLISGIEYSIDMLGYNLVVISHLVSSAWQTGNAELVTDNVSGPVGIATSVGDILGLGGRDAAVGMLNLLGVLSLSLAFMNILPIPAMDGGRLAFLLVEALFGKKMAAEKENMINQVGFVLLLGLIILISYNDVVRLFKR